MITPPLEKRYKPLPKDMYKKGEFIHYECQDPSAILDDDSGRNFFSLLCDGDDTLGIYDAAYNLTEIVEESNETSTAVTEVSESFTPINSSFEFPKCREICNNFYVGRVDFKAVNESVEVRAGDIAEFTCNEGYFIDGTDHFNRTIISQCRDDGTFTPTISKCTPIPCTDEDITFVTPLNGIFMTDAEDEISFGESITFECTDEDKVPNEIGVPELEVRCLLGGHFEVPQWPQEPGCVYTCSNFPNVPKMKKVSNEPVLVGRAIEYICRNSKKVPNTGERFYINCTEAGEGTFEGELENFPGDDWPECEIGCVDFPLIENFKPVDRMFKLPNDTTIYECAKSGLIPHTNESLVLQCLENGTFIPMSEAPKCVRPDTCRQPEFPTHPQYIVAFEEKVSYNFDDWIKVYTIPNQHAANT